MVVGGRVAWIVGMGLCGGQPGNGHVMCAYGPGPWGPRVPALDQGGGGSAGRPAMRASHTSSFFRQSVFTLFKHRVSATWLYMVPQIHTEMGQTPSKIAQIPTELAQGIRTRL